MKYSLKYIPFEVKLFCLWRYPKKWWYRLPQSRQNQNTS